jgi:hypothetical protein
VILLNYIHFIKTFNKKLPTPTTFRQIGKQHARNAGLFPSATGKIGAFTRLSIGRARQNGRG